MVFGEPRRGEERMCAKCERDRRRGEGPRIRWGKSREDRCCQREGRYGYQAQFLCVPHLFVGAVEIRSCLHFCRFVRRFFDIFLFSAGNANASPIPMRSSIRLLASWRNLCLPIPMRLLPISLTPSLRRPPHIVAIQLLSFRPVGTAMIIVAAVK